MFSAPHPRWRSGPAKGSGRGRKRPRTRTNDQDSDAEHNPDDTKIKAEETDDEAAYEVSRELLSIYAYD